MDGHALANLRSAIAADIAGLARPSFIRSQHRHRYDGPSTPASTGPADAHATAGVNGETALLDDERRMRLLAREIKRLIVEDVRRGIDI